MTMIQRSDHHYGPDARNRLAEAHQHCDEGARAVLESFYYALNQRDESALRQVWSIDPLAQLNNPLGGILHGGDAIAELYGRVFHGAVRVSVTFGDIVEYLDADHAVFAGRETGSYRTAHGDQVPLSIRTTRYLRFTDGRWWQYHHHGSIDDPTALAAYQHAVTG